MVTQAAGAGWPPLVQGGEMLFDYSIVGTGQPPLVQNGEAHTTLTGGKGSKEDAHSGLGDHPV